MYDGFCRAITYRIDGASQPTALIENYVLGDRFDLTIEVGSDLVKILVNGKVKATFEATDSSAYFKAGAYVQSNVSKGDDPDAYGEVVVYSLSMD